MSMRHILDRLGRVAAYDGPWRPLREECGRLQTRVHEMRERESRLDDVLVVALVGGSGVGKSTLLNALAGDELAKTSEYRPCTSVPTVYHPPGTQLEFGTETNHVAGSALENLVIVDTPDSDTVIKTHRDSVIKVLEKCDLVLVCADAEKYLDEATWSLLRPLRDERTLVCIETKGSSAPSIREHWQQRMGEEGFQVTDYFHINALRAFDRKVAGREPGDDEFGFGTLEQFLYRELTNERIQRIKRSNTAGLLAKTLTTLEERVVAEAAALNAANEAIAAAETELVTASFEVVQRRLFSEPHLWNFALGREAGMRARGVIGSIYRVLEAARTLPARLSRWSLWPLRENTGTRAAQMLATGDLIGDDLSLASADLSRAYDAQASGIGVAMAQAGFESIEGGGYENYSEELTTRVGDVLRGPAHDRIVRASRLLTAWPLAILLDLPPVAFFTYTAFDLVRDYFQNVILSGAFLVHSLSVLAILVLAELLLLTVLARGLAWTARKAASRDLKQALLGMKIGFSAERAAIAAAQDKVSEIQDLSEQLRENSANR